MLDFDVANYWAEAGDKEDVHIDILYQLRDGGWYVAVDDYVITVNTHSFTITTTPQQTRVEDRDCSRGSLFVLLDSSE